MRSDYIYIVDQSPTLRKDRKNGARCVQQFDLNDVPLSISTVLHVAGGAHIVGARKEAIHIHRLGAQPEAARQWLYGENAGDTLMIS